MIKALLGMCIVSLYWVMVVPQVAQAHVLIRDEAKLIGAVLHITPDDDPVAGQPANLFFDLQKVTGGQAYAAKLQIRDSAGRQDEVPVSINKGSASARYIFPVQDTYSLKLTITAKGRPYVFEYTQRVSRGTVGSALDRPTYLWAEAALIASICTFALLMIVAFNRRKTIAVNSRF